MSDHLCPFTIRREDLPEEIPARRRAAADEVSRCLVSAGHRCKHAIAIESIVYDVPKRAAGRPQLDEGEKLSEVVWVRLPRDTVNAVEKLQGDRPKSEIVRQLVEEALSARRA